MFGYKVSPTFENFTLLSYDLLYNSNAQDNDKHLKRTIALKDGR